MKKKVVVTGLGAVCSLGNNVNDMWENLVNGVSGVTKITKISTENLDTLIAAQVNDEFENEAQKYISKRQKKQMSRSTRMSLLASNQAIEDSKLDFESIDKSKVGIVIGVIDTSFDENERAESLSHISVKTMPNAPAAWVAIQHKIEGPSFNLSTACASAAYAIAVGCSFIESGLCDVVIVGGVGSSVHNEQVYSFNQIMAMSVNNEHPLTASRPFDQTRDGFVMGEGAGTLVIESEASALKRNANIYCEIAGYSITSEAGDITAPKEDGEGMAKSMEIAIANANLSFESIDYINAHGTSTYLNDKYETSAIKKVFKDKAYSIPVSSTKSMIGHTLAAAGVLEGITTILSIKHGIITPTINYNTPDPELDLDYVPNKSRNQNVDVALSNSFGFGGHNSTIVYKKYIGEQ